MRWVSSWSCYWWVIPSVSAPSSMPAFLLGSINFGKKVLWVSWCLYCSTGVLVWQEEVTSSGSMSLMQWVTVKFTLIDSLPLVLPQVSVSSWRCSLPMCPCQLQISTHFHSHLAIFPVFPHTWSWTLSPHYPPHPSSLTFSPSTSLLWLFYSPILSEIQAFLFDPSSSMFRFFGSLRYNMVPAFYG